MAQKIKVVNTRTATPVTFITRGIHSFEDLKATISDNITEFSSFDWSNSRVILKKAGQDPKTVSLDSEQVFSGDFTVFITPLKVSQGVSYQEKEELEKVHDQLLEILDSVNNILGEGLSGDDRVEGLTEEEQELFRSLND